MESLVRKESKEELLKAVLNLVSKGLSEEVMVEERVPDVIIRIFDQLHTLTTTQKAVEILDIISCSPSIEHSQKLLELGVVDKLLPLLTVDYPELQEVVSLILHLVYNDTHKHGNIRR